MASHAWRASLTEPSSSMVEMSPGSRPSDCPQHPPHDLAAASLGEAAHEIDLADDRDRAEFVPDHAGQFPSVFLRRLVTLFERDESRDHFHPHRVGAAGHGGLGDGRVVQEGGLHLDGAQAVTGDLDDLIGPAAEPQVAVVVELGGVTAEIKVLAGMRCQ
jgi:hypothetical protein